MGIKTAFVKFVSCAFAIAAGLPAGLHAILV
jgi:hypothetical protein